MTRHIPNAAARRAYLRAAAFMLSAALLFASAAGEIVPCATLRDAYFLGRAAEDARAGEVRFSLPAAVLNQPHRIHEDKGTPGEWDEHDAVWNMIYLFPSVYMMSYAVYPRDGEMRVDLYFYYRDGVRLLDANREGGTLGAPEAAALEKAKAIAAGADPTLPPRERLFNLCEALCGAITFLDPRDAPEGWDVKSCVTALTRGRANCQGYADAFFLAASLAGFEVRYQNGWNRSGESHTWNRALIDGAWLDVDLTWMDSGGGNPEKYFMTDPSGPVPGHIPEESGWPLSPDQAGCAVKTDPLTVSGRR